MYSENYINSRVDETLCRFCGKPISIDRIEKGVLLCVKCVRPSRKATYEEQRNIPGTLVYNYEHGV